MKRLFFLLLCLLPIFSFAQSYHFVATSNKAFRPIDEDQVVVYNDESEVPDDAEKVGIIICKSNKEHKVLLKAKRLAAQNGANAIYYTSVETITKGEEAMNIWLGAGYKGKYKISAVYVKRIKASANN